MLFQGVSPIISHTPMNRVADVPSENQLGFPLGETPKMRPKLLSPRRSTLFLGVVEDGSNPLLAFQNAKQEMQILEHLKSLALDIFNVVSQVKQVKQKIAIFESYQGQLDQVAMQQELMSEKSLAIF